MATIKFTPEEKAAFVGKIQTYFHKQLDYEIGAFDAEFLMDFFADDLGAYFYNRGLLDAQTLLAAKVADITDAIVELEKPTTIAR